MPKRIGFDVAIGGNVRIGGKLEFGAWQPQDVQQLLVFGEASGPFQKLEALAERPAIPGPLLFPGEGQQVTGVVGWQDADGTGTPIPVGRPYTEKRPMTVVGAVGVQHVRCTSNPVALPRIPH